MDRKAAGWLLLVATVLAAVAIAPLVGPGIRGFPVAGPLPDPPPAGSCLGATAGGLVVVDCAEPHVVEVVRAWQVADPAVAAVETMEQNRACSRIARQYLGADPSDRIPRIGYRIPALTGEWSAVPMVVSTGMMSGPAGPSPIGYRACVLRPQAPTGATTEIGPIAGAVADLVMMQARPTTLRTCYISRDLVNVGMPCAATHVGEVLASAEVDPGGKLEAAAEDPAFAAGCLAVAAELIGVADPTFGGQLSVQVDGRVVIRDAVNGQSDTQQIGLLRCVVEAVDGRTLSGSVIDLDDRPLPVR